ncbi:hypothetical protein B0H21DRAFT_732224 [Amylocystis lapponica]|nr:hypothetical protein B0H21DRAFT_732224 [Amylocystis lapponica]
MPELYNCINATVVWDDEGLHEELVEYAVTHAGEHDVNCYIASEARKSFGIIIDNHGLEAEAVLYCYIDGQLTETKLINDPGQASLLFGPTDSSGKNYRPYTFADIVVTDDDTIANPHDLSSKDLGTIEIRVIRVRVDADSESCLNATTESEIHKLSLAPIHERSKKVGAHRVSLGSPIPAINQPISEVDVALIDTIDAPYARFRFNYRSLEILKAQGIIPLSAPEPADDETNSTATDNGKKRAHTDYNPVTVSMKKMRHSEDPTQEERKPVNESDDEELASLRQLLVTISGRLERKIEEKKRRRRSSGVPVKREVTGKDSSPTIIDLTGDA